ncbi:MAG: hypothetical protein ABIJ75_01355 [Actinomycetota bacterium]
MTDRTAADLAVARNTYGDFTAEADWAPAHTHPWGACLACVPDPKYRVEVRHADDGSGDIEAVQLFDSERCLFLLERWTGDEWGLSLRPVHSSLAGIRYFNIARRKKRVEVTEG